MIYQLLPLPQTHQLLESALKGVQGRFPVSEAEEPRVGIVRLNGLVTCDDRTVFKELASQLCRQEPPLIPWSPCPPFRFLSISCNASIERALLWR